MRGWNYYKKHAKEGVSNINKLRYKFFEIDFQGDCRFPKERIKGKDKRLLRKWTARKKYKEWLKGEDDYGGG